MVIVDTSIWIRFLAGREPYARSLDDLLAHDRVFGHDFVEGELLVGDSGRVRIELLDAYTRIERAFMVPHAEVAELVRARRLAGRGIGWIDAHLVASALVERCFLWTADASLAAVAEQLRVGHDPAA